MFEHIGNYLMENPQNLGRAMMFIGFLITISILIVGLTPIGLKGKVYCAMSRIKNLEIKK